MFRTTISMLIAFVCSLSAIAQTKDQRIQKKIDEAIAYYKYPIDKRTKRISYEHLVSVPNTSKATLFKRASQYVALQDYGRTENIRCKNNTNITTQIVDGTLLVNDPEDGKLVGYGFYHLDWHIRAEYKYVITFKYKIAVNDNVYKYEFTDFRILEFLSAPKEKSKGSSYASSTGAGAIGTSSSLRTFSDASLIQKDLEDFIIGNLWQNQDAGHTAYKAKMEIIFGDLKEVMTGGL